MIMFATTYNRNIIYKILKCILSPNNHIKCNKLRHKMYFTISNCNASIPILISL